MTRVVVVVVEGAESEKAERTSVQGVGVTASRPLDLLDVLQDHVV